MLLQWMSYTIAIIAAIIVGIDFMPIMRDWVGRIHIGRYSDRTIWLRSITRMGAKWLNDTPRIKVTDNTRLVVLDMLKGNYTKSAIQHWQEAALLLGLTQYLESERDERVVQQIKAFLAAKFDMNGQWRQPPEQIDAAILSYAVLKLNSVDSNRYRPAFDYTWHLIQSHIGEDGTVQYRKTMKHYRYVDTIGFICPFLIAYGIKYDKEECVQLALKQLSQYEQHGMLPEHYIPSHAYRLNNSLPLGLYGWGRGLGWFAIGLIDAWNELPMKHPARSELEGMIRKFAGAVLAFQHPAGCWNWSVARGESRADSSTTATLGWFLLQASRIADLAPACMEGADKAVNYLMKVTRRSGAIDFSQGDTKDIGVYSMLFNILPFTQGFSIRMIHAHKQLKAG